MGRDIVVADPLPGHLVDLLEDAGQAVTRAATRSELLAATAWGSVRLVILSTALAGGNGLEVLDEIHALHPGLPVLAVTGPGREQDAARALRGGATDCQRLPCPDSEFLARVDRLLAAAPVQPDEAPTHDVMGTDGEPRPVFHRSAAMRQAVEMLVRIAPARSTVLLLGESGVGKELFARSIHFNSPRRDGPWVPLNCTAIPEALVEAEMFGHEKGAFTGAVGRTPGMFEMAHKGTIFLDEIGDMSLAAQVKLLRVLEDKQLMRVGGTHPVEVDVRLVAATNSDLEARVRLGQFRQDLFYRLNVITLRIPSLRERREDLPALMTHFLHLAATANSLPPRQLHPETTVLLQSYPWPGNVRELKNLMESLVITIPHLEITPDDLPARFHQGGAARAMPGGLQSGMTLREAERLLIQATMHSVAGNRTRGAGMLGIGVRTLQRKLRLYDLADTGRRSS
jgi:DNA-binding NtrC family response regulator